MKDLLAGRAGCEHFGSEGARDLNSDVADAAGAAMDQHFLRGMHGRAIDQPFPCGDEDQRNGRGLTHGKVGWLWREQIGIDRCILRQRTLQAANAASHSIDFVAAAKGCHAVTGPLDDAGKIDTQHRRQWLTRMSGLPGSKS